VDREGTTPGTVRTARIIEEALESEAAEALGRRHYTRGAVSGEGYHNDYEGTLEYSAPQIADRLEPFRSTVRVILGGGAARR